MLLALYGKPYIKAAKDTWTMFMDRGTLCPCHFFHKHSHDAQYFRDWCACQRFIGWHEWVASWECWRLLMVFGSFDVGSVCHWASMLTLRVSLPAPCVLNQYTWGIGTIVIAQWHTLHTTPMDSIQHRLSCLHSSLDYNVVRTFFWSLDSSTWLSIFCSDDDVNCHRGRCIYYVCANLSVSMWILADLLEIQFRRSWRRSTSLSCSRTWPI
jgi:hypothetical protein